MIPLHAARRLATTCVLAALVLLPDSLSGNAWATNPAEDALGALRLYLEKETTGLQGRVEIVVGNLDPNLSLTPCTRVEPFIPPGTRLWGKALIGLRCLDKAGWTAWLPVEIKVSGPALVAAGPLAAGQSLSERDVRIEEIDLTRESGTVSTLPQIADRVLARAVPAGRVLRHEQFRVRPLVSQGDPVKVLYSGAGFSVSTDAQSLGQATAGQSLRVKTASGKILTGILQAGRTVEVSF